MLWETTPSCMAASRFKWYWLLVHEVTGSNPPGSYISTMHLLICFFVTDFVRKMGAHPGLAKGPLIPFNVQKMDFLPNRLSVINKL